MEVTTLVSGLLRATSLLDGDALVLNVGERPHVVSSAGATNIGTRPLPAAVVIDLLGQLLPMAARAELDRLGTVRYTLPQLPELPDDQFTVMASQASTVRLEVRRVRAIARHAADGHPAMPFSRRTRGQPLVLLIDDSPDQLDMYALVLSDTYQVLQAAHGESGIDFAVTNRPDVVVVDLHMPGIDGWEVCRRLRTDPRTASIPIIALTALHEPDLRDRAMRAGAVDLLLKPCPVDTLKDRIAAILEVTGW